MSESPFYAQGTGVSVEKTRAELDTLLGKHGASSRAILTDDAADQALVVFVLRGLKYKLVLPLPKRAEHATRSLPPGGWRWSSDRQKAWREKAWEQACRERWRQVLLLVKAKLELVRLGVTTAEHEFMADLVLANGETVHHALGAEIARALADGSMPLLALPPGPR